MFTDLSLKRSALISAHFAIKKYNLRLKNMTMECFNIKSKDYVKNALEF